MRKSHTNKNKGFLMVEVLVAASIIAVAILSAMAVAQKSSQIARQSLHAAQAAFLLEEGAEAVRIMRDNDWENISGLASGTDYHPVFSGGTWTLSPAPNTVGIFDRSVRVEEVSRDASGDIAGSGSPDAGTRLVTVTVSWTEGGTVVTKTLRFYVMDIFS